MKIHLMQVINKIKLRRLEMNYKFKRSLSRKWDHFLHWGHGKLTVMLIPHNERKIFNFQISKFTFLFFLFLFIGVVATSVISVQRNRSIRQEEKDILFKFKTKQAQLYEIQKLSHEVQTMFSEIRPEIQEVYTLATGSRDVDQIWEEPLNEKKRETIDHQIVGNSPIQKEINDLIQLQNEIMIASSTIQSIQPFVEERYRVERNSPSAVPYRGHITSLFGWRRSPFGFGREFHQGIDIAGPMGTPIRATAPGKVSFSGWRGGYGNAVIIEHEYGFSTLYGHNSSNAVESGDFVYKGQVIAYVGQTGAATGNHCHYEVRLGNVPINPAPYMRDLQ